jgi:hypothetical protein
MTVRKYAIAGRDSVRSTIAPAVEHLRTETTAANGTKTEHGAKIEPAPPATAGKAGVAQWQSN